LRKVEELYDEVIAPFLKRCPQLGLAPGSPDTHSLYLWATAVVSAYSFTVGDDRSCSIISSICYSLTAPLRIALYFKFDCH
jgi:hypothetical protein